MYRNIINELIKWKESPDRKPLILLGARQVGKTYILKHFGNTCYKNVAYINCDNNARVKDLFAEEDGVAIGFALFFHNFSTFVGRKGLYLEDLFIIPEKRGRGYGKALLKYLARTAVERNCGRMEWICLDWNQPALNVYRSIGAVPMDEWTVHRLSETALKQFADSKIN